MDDVIYRQPILDSYNRICESCGEDKKYGGAICRSCYLDDAISIVEDAPSAQQWIPCSERLPEEDGTYFVSGVWENGDVEVGQLEYIADEHRFSNVIYFNVDAWMPLPEPYRKEAAE